MKFKIKLHNVCANDELRPVMQCILFDGDKFIASDANILAVIHVDDLEINDEEKETLLNLKGKLLHKKGFAKIWNKEIFLTDTGLDCPSEKIFIPFETENFEYPAWQSVIPSLRGIKKFAKVSIDSGLLIKLTQCIVTENTRIRVTLFFSRENGAIVVFSAFGSIKSYGIIMPTSDLIDYVPELNRDSMLFSHVK